MELFLPSLFVIMFAGICIFFLVPRFSPFIIFVICVIFLFISVQSHYYTFAREYNNMIIFDVFKNTPTLLIIVITIGVIIAVLNLFTGFKFTMPSFTVDTGLKVITDKTNYKNVAIDEIKELERQL